MKEPALVQEYCVFIVSPCTFLHLFHALTTNSPSYKTSKNTYGLISKVPIFLLELIFALKNFYNTFYLCNLNLTK